jgi:hypothetical protein
LSLSLFFLTFPISLHGDEWEGICCTYETRYIGVYLRHKVTDYFQVTNLMHTSFIL